MELVLLDVNGSDVKEPNQTNDNSVDNLDAEYEALCASYEGALV